MGSSHRKETVQQQSAHQIHKDSQQIQFKQNDFIRQIQGSIAQCYQILSPYLKQNQFYQLRKAIHLKTKLIRSVYIINKYKIRTSQREALQNQINKLKLIDHPNINKIYELFKDNHHYFIVMELCHGQSLANIIEKETFINQKRAASIMYQLFSLLKYCHSRGILHTDLKLQNIIFNSEKQDIIKVVDFSISKIFRIEDIIEQTKNKAFLSSPQSLQHELSSKSDIWQCGMILYILLCGQAPILGNKKSKLVRKALYCTFQLQTDYPTFSQKRWHFISRQAKEIIRSLLNVNPNDRPPAEDCLKSNWINKCFKRPLISSINLKRCLFQCYHFNPLSKLQQATWSFFVNVLVPFSEKQNILYVFNKLDLEGKGELDFDDIQKGFRLIFENQKKANFFTDLILKRLQKDKISFSQFITIATNRTFLITQSNVRKIFSIFDEDGSGEISVSEVKNVLGGSKQISQQIWLELMKEADANSDGMISFQQFRNMMKSLLLNKQSEWIFEQSENKLQQISWSDFQIE